MPPYFSKEASDFISQLLEKIVSKKFSDKILAS